MMKKSPTSSSSSSSSSTSSSSSCIVGGSSYQDSEIPKSIKRPRKRAKCENPNNNNNTPPAISKGTKRSSIYRGVTRHRWTGRFEAHLWDKGSWNNIQNKKGKQVYLGAYDNEDSAATTYDLAALKYWGSDTFLNFPIDRYTKEIEEMDKVSKEEYLASLRRRSSGFSRGISKYRGVARHHHNGRWEARIGRVLGNKYLYLGTYNTQEEAAAAYDMAALEYRGANAVTNFNINSYIDQLKKKGINIAAFDHLQQHQIPPEPKPETETKTEPKTNPKHQSPPRSAEPHIKNQQQIMISPPPPQSEQVATPQEEGQPKDNKSSSIAVMNETDELNWSFCMEPGFNPFPVPQFPFGDLPNLFDGNSFEDNILDLIFNTSIDVDVDGLDIDGQHGFSTSSPSSSTTTSISVNYSI